MWDCRCREISAISDIHHKMAHGKLLPKNAQRVHAVS